MYRTSIKHFIEKQGYSQKEIAFQLSISKQALNNKLNGRAHFSIDEIKILCIIFPKNAILNILNEYISDPYTKTS